MCFYFRFQFEHYDLKRGKKYNLSPKIIILFFSPQIAFFEILDFFKMQKWILQFLKPPKMCFCTFETVKKGIFCPTKFLNFNFRLTVVVASLFHFLEFSQSLSL